MQRSEYLNDRCVSRFIKWSTDLVSGDRGLKHSWIDGRYNKKEFTSLFEAVEKYDWWGDSFKDVCEKFCGFRADIRRCMNADPVTHEDRSRFLKTAKAIAKWGGINNLGSLDALGMNALSELSANAEKLDPKHADTSDLSRLMLMGSGYSKIYSAMIEDFPIYDSRVACALASLIRMYLSSHDILSIPEALELRVTKGRAVVNRAIPGFPELFPGPAYADSNLRAAWILGAWADVDGKFKTEFPDRQDRIMALQSALFMLGYAPLI